MIPKIIHYVWGKGQEKSILAKQCIASWKYHNPDFKIQEYNEDLVDYHSLKKKCSFFKICSEKKLWAFMSDYLRLHAIYEYGGIYLDTDVQLFDSLTPYLRHKLFIPLHVGFDPVGNPTGDYVEPAILGAVPKHPYIAAIIEFYEKTMHKSHLIYASHVSTEVLNQKYDFNARLTKAKKNTTTKMLLSDGIVIYPNSYFFPTNDDINNWRYSPLKTVHDTKSNKAKPFFTSIHWFQNSYGKQPNVYLHTKSYNGLKKVLFALIILSKYYGYKIVPEVIKNKKWFKYFMGLIQQRRQRKRNRIHF